MTIGDGVVRSITSRSYYEPNNNNSYSVSCETFDDCSLHNLTIDQYDSGDFDIYTNARTVVWVKMDMFFYKYNSRDVIRHKSGYKFDSLGNGHYNIRYFSCQIKPGDDEEFRYFSRGATSEISGEVFFRSDNARNAVFEMGYLLKFLIDSELFSDEDLPVARAIYGVLYSIPNN